MASETIFRLFQRGHFYDYQLTVVANPSGKATFTLTPEGPYHQGDQVQVRDDVAHPTPSLAGRLEACPPCTGRDACAPCTGLARKVPVRGHRLVAQGDQTP